MRRWFPVVVFVFIIAAVWGDDLPEEEEVYRLPEAEVSADRDTPELISREEMDREGSNDLWEAVQFVPGIILSGGGRRNDSNFSVRGFGPDSVPVYVDGIPLANPYRGEGDSARILTGDMESIEIKKGFSTELLGANTLGGAILLRTAKPKDLFEASLKTGFGLDSIFNYANSTTVLTLGTRLKYFYTKVVYQYRDVDHFRLPDSFEVTPNNPQQKGDRLWSDSQDSKLTLMAGTTPLPDLDIWLTYIYQDANKGVSPPDTVTREYSIWEWPVWRRYSISLNSTWEIASFSFDGLFYFDKYDNRLDEYLNMTKYNKGAHFPHSDYDEYSLGGRFITKWDINSWNILQMAVTYKKEDHRGLKGGIVKTPEEDELIELTHINEDTWSVGTEYSIKPWKPLTIKAGIGFDSLLPQKYWNDDNEMLKLMKDSYFIVKTRNMLLYTWQAGIFYQFFQSDEIPLDQELRFTYARKNHFPNMSQRYSTQFGTSLPNPRLGPEIANHFELGYRFYFNNSENFISALTLNTALYYSIIDGKIVSVSWPNPNNPTASVDLYRNLDSTSFWGFELAPELSVKKFLSAGFAFSWNRYSINRSQNGIEILTYYPEITLNGYMVIKPVKNISIIPRAEYIGSRYADSEGKYPLDSYYLAHLKIAADIGSYFSISASIENIFDTYYEIRQYSPMAGRSFNFSFTARY